MKFPILSLSLLVLLSSSALAEGNVYRIAEPDALEEIEQKAREADWESEMSKDQNFRAAARPEKDPYKQVVTT